MVTSPSRARRHHIGTENDGRFRITEIESGVHELSVDASGRLAVKSSPSTWRRTARLDLEAATEVHVSGPIAGDSFANRGR